MVECRGPLHQCVYLPLYQISVHSSLRVAEHIVAECAQSLPKQHLRPPSPPQQKHRSFQFWGSGTKSLQGDAFNGQYKGFTSVETLNLTPWALVHEKPQKVRICGVSNTGWRTRPDLMSQHLRR